MAAITIETQTHIDTAFSLFDDLANRIAQEPAMFPVQADTLYNSWTNRKAVAIYDEYQGRIKAFARLGPLLESQTKEQLGMGADTPNVWELGSVYVSPEYRGDGITADEVMEEMFGLIKELQETSGDIVLGTLVDIRMLKKLRSSSNQDIRTILTNPFGSVSDEIKTNSLGMLTCVCDSPNKKGVQHGQNECLTRTDSLEHFDLDNLNNAIQTKQIQIADDGGLGACYMFVMGNTENLFQFERAVTNRFGFGENGQVLPTEETMHRFRQELIDIQYFSHDLGSNY